MSKHFSLYAGVAVIVSFATSAYAGLEFGHQTSAFTFEANTKFVVLSPTLIIDEGTIKKNTGASIEGSIIDFDDGVYATSISEVGLTGRLDGVGTFGMLLEGNGDRFNAEPGQVVDRVLVSGDNNRIEGQPVFTLQDGITLQDAATTVTIAINNVLGQNIVLNDGTLVLENELGLGDDVTISSGRVKLNGNRLNLGATTTSWTSSILWDNASDITMNGEVDLAGTWVFQGNANLNGNGNTLNLDAGLIRVTPGSTLTIHDVVIEGLKTNNLRCEGITSSLVIEGSDLYLSHNYSFTSGSIAFAQDVRISGTNIFSYESSQTSTILSNAQLRVKNATFQYAPITDNRDLIAFEDQTSIFFLDGCSLVTTITGMRFTKGMLLVDQKNGLTNNSAVSVSQGFAFGDGTPANDIYIKIKPAGSLDLLSGIISYQNDN